MHEKELEILEHLHQDTSLHQRDLSRIVGLSLGMTNVILKRLATKGFLMVRKVNNRNIKYIVSPAGVEEISKRSYNYFKRTIKNIVFYKEQLEHTLRRLKEQGIERIFLEGESDVDFLIEHLCSKTGLQFSRTANGYRPRNNECILVSENEVPLSMQTLLNGASSHTYLSGKPLTDMAPGPEVPVAEGTEDSREGVRLYLRNLLIRT